MNLIHRFNAGMEFVESNLSVLIQKYVRLDTHNVLTTLVWEEGLRIVKPWGNVEL